MSVESVTECPAVTPAGAGDDLARPELLASTREEVAPQSHQHAFLSLRARFEVAR